MADWLEALLYQQEQATADAIAMAAQQEGGKELGVTMDFSDPDTMGEAMYGEAWYDQPLYLDWQTGEPIEAPTSPSSTTKPPVQPASPPIAQAALARGKSPWLALLLLAGLVAGAYYATR